MNLDFRILIRLFIFSLVGGVVGNALINLIGTLLLQAGSGLSHPAGLLFSGFGTVLIFALFYTLGVYQRVAAGVGLDLRWALLTGLMWGGIFLLFGIFSFPGLAPLLLMFWQGVAMSVGAFIAIRLMP